MDIIALQKKYNRRGAARNALLVTVGVLILANLFLSFRIFSQSNQVVLVPTHIADGMVARGAVDKRYLEALALDAIYALYNVSPNALDYGRTVIERIASVEERPRLLQQYDRIAGDIRARKISTVFLPQKIEHNFTRMEAVVTGRLQTYLETTQVSSEVRRILLTFKSEAGSVRLNSIGKLEDQS